MLTLGIETSGRDASIALRRDGVCVEERMLTSSGRRHAQTLVAEIEALLRQHQLTPRDCQLVAVSQGPGSFTGLRIGVVFAKTFAFAVSCPIAAVDTYLAVAEGGPADVDRVVVIGDAQREQLFVGHYVRCPDSGWSRIGTITIQNAADWCPMRQPADVVSGPGLVRFRSQLPAHCQVLNERFWMPRAGQIARIGERNCLAGQCADLWTLEPFYLRKSAAEEKLEHPHTSERLF